MKDTELIAKLKEISNTNTIYGKGMIGKVITDDVIAFEKQMYPSWYTEARVAQFKNLVGKNYRGFDCVCLIKSVLFWGFPNIAYDVKTDYTELGLLEHCTEVSADFNNIVDGELVYQVGHVGVIVDSKNRLVCECTPMWKNGVQITKLDGRGWQKHGKLPNVEYSAHAAKKEGVYKMTTLSLGVTNNDVTIFETLMRKMGLYSGAIDNHFGQGCLAACNAFQTQYPECGTNGQPDGCFGAASWNKLLSLFRG